MTCDHCDAELRPGDRFCLTCGHAVSTDGDETTPAKVAIEPPAPPADLPAESAGPGAFQADAASQQASPGVEVTATMPQPDLDAMPDPATARTGQPASSVDGPTPQAAADTMPSPGLPASPPAAVAQPAPIGQPQPGSQPGRTVRSPDLLVPGLLTTHWPLAVRVAGAMFIIEALFHAVPGLVQAFAGLVRDGVAPEPLGDFFRLPFQSMIAANGAVAGVGVWLTGAAVTAAAAGMGWRRLDQTGGPIEPVDRVVLALKVALAHAVLLVGLSWLIEASRLELSGEVDLPGTLGLLDSFGRWARPQLLVLSTATVALGVVLAQLPGLLTRLPAVAQAIAAALRASLAMLLGAGLLVVAAGALELPDEPNGRRWLADALDYLATSLLGLLDLGAHRLAIAVDAVVSDARSVDPIRGPWVAVIVIVAVGVAVGAIRHWYRLWHGPTNVVAGIVASLVPGFGLVVADWVNQLEGELFRAAIVLAFLVGILVVLTNPVVIPQIRELFAPKAAPAGQQPVAAQRQCQTCANPLQPTSRFCGRCGTPAG